MCLISVAYHILFPLLTNEFVHLVFFHYDESPCLLLYEMHIFPCNTVYLWIGSRFINRVIWDQTGINWCIAIRHIITLLKMILWKWKIPCCSLFISYGTRRPSVDLSHKTYYCLLYSTKQVIVRLGNSKCWF